MLNCIDKGFSLICFSVVGTNNLNVKNVAETIYRWASEHNVTASINKYSFNIRAEPCEDEDRDGDGE